MRTGRFTPARRTAAVVAVATALVAGVTIPAATAAQEMQRTPGRSTGGGGEVDQSTVATGQPNDPGYTHCQSANDPGCGGSDSSNWGLYGPLTGPCIDPATGLATLPRPDQGLPCFAPLAKDPQHAAGMNLPGAWTQGNLGHDVLVAYIEGGVNYSSDGIKDGLDNVWLNAGELPYPERADGHDAGTYDLNHDGRFDIADWAQDPRVNPPCAPGVAPFVTRAEGTTRSCVAGGTHPYLHSVHVGGVLTPYLSPEDLIAVFGDCRIAGGRVRTCRSGLHVDNDGNGYPNDISGWNFERNSNDPQTEDFAYNHAPGLISRIGGVGDNGFGSVGYCPQCRVVPVKQDAETIGRSDRFAEAILYATDIGAKAISAVVVNDAYSSIDQAAVDYAWSRGVAMSFDSNDFDSMDHTNGMYFDHVVPGNSLTVDNDGGPGNDARWYRARSNVTSYGTHNVFSFEGGSTSAATPTGAAALAMVASAGLEARDRHVIPGPLDPDEIKQVLMDTASTVDPTQAPPGTTPQWPGNPGSHTDATHTAWSTQYGYGRPDLGAATAMVLAGRIPPRAVLTGPRWYDYVDPVQTPRLDVTGQVARSSVGSGGSAHYVLEWALGADPADSAFHTVASGTVGRGQDRDARAVARRLGTIDLRQVPASFYDHAPSTTLQPDGAEQYTMTIRLRVVDANGTKAEDRRAIHLRHDPTLSPGFPKTVQRADGGPPAAADLEGRHELDVIDATNDGLVYAWRPDGSSVPGFPVRSDRLADIDPANPQNLRAPAYREPIFRNASDPLGGGVAVGDLFHDGRLEVAATSTNGDLYVWDAHGRRLPGFPVHTDPSRWSLPVPTPAAPESHSRLPQRGNWSPPVLADLEGTGHLDLLMSAFDGRLYAWRPDGTPVPGWPVEIKLPDATRAALGTAYIRDPKLIFPAGVADVLHTGRPQVFVSSFESGGNRSYLYGIWPDGNDHPGGPFLPGWPATVPALQGTYDQSIDFVGEGNAAPVFVDIAGATRIVTASVFGFPLVLNGNGTTFENLDPTCAGAACTSPAQYRVPDGLTLEITGMGGAGDLDGDGHPEYVASQLGLTSLTTALGQAGTALLPQAYEKAWTLATGARVAGFPARQDGFTFFTSPVVGNVDGSAGRAAIEGNDNYFVHAYRADGSEASGFPKYTGGWELAAGLLYDPHLDGHLHYLQTTREGFVFDWTTTGDATRNDAWWRYRHDERNTGDTRADTRRPAVLADLHVDDGVLRWHAPGDDGVVGTAAAYTFVWSSSRNGPRGLLSPPVPAIAGTPQELPLPAGLPRHGPVWVTAWSRDDAGNLSAPAVACIRGCSTSTRPAT
jgi:hypothetical protein